MNIAMFELKPEESALKILLCTKEGSEKLLQNIQMADLATLPKLPYPTQGYDLALSAQILFNDKLSYTENFHIELLMELCRVANEVRVCPVVNSEGEPSQYLGPVLKILQEKEFGVELTQANFAHKPHQALLRVWNPACDIKVNKNT